MCFRNEELDKLQAQVKACSARYVKIHQII